MTEKEKLENEIRQLNEKITKLRSEYYVETTNKIKLLDEIKPIRDTLIALREEWKKLNHENNIVRNDTNEQLKEIAKQKYELKQAQSKYDSLYSDFLVGKEEYAQDLKNLKEDQTMLKREKLELISVGNTLVKDRSMFEAAKKKLEADIISFATQKKEAFDLIEDQKLETIKNITLSEQIKEQYELSLEEVNSRVIDLDAQRGIVESMKKAVINLNIEAENKIKLLDTKIKECELKKAGFDRAVEDLKTKENEFKIRELRISKMIRDNGIASQLAQLEKELSK